MDASTHPHEFEGHHEPPCLDPSDRDLTPSTDADIELCEIACRGDNVPSYQCESCSVKICNDCAQRDCMRVWNGAKYIYFCRQECTSEAIAFARMVGSQVEPGNELDNRDLEQYGLMHIVVPVRDSEPRFDAHDNTFIENQARYSVRHTPEQAAFIERALELRKTPNGVSLLAMIGRCVNAKTATTWQNAIEKARAA